MMTIAAARALRDGQACFVGIGLPSTAANLARRLHAPNLVLIYESGTLGSRPDQLPLSIGDGVLAESALTVVSVPEVFNYWLQPGRVDVGFLSGAQIDRFGNINTTVIGSYDEPLVRLPGSGGAPEIAASCREVIVIMRHKRRAFVELVDFVTSVGHGLGPGDRARLGLRGAGPVRVITDVGVLEPDPGQRRAGAHRAAPGLHRRAGHGRDRLDPAGVAGPDRLPGADHRRAGRAARAAGGRLMTEPVRLHHVADGPADGPPLVLAGSLGSTLDMWRPQVGPLSERFRLLRLDHRGHGGSPVPPGPYRMADLAGDVLALLDELGLDRVAWCGLSLGGMVGMYLASEHPDRISRLILCCTSAYFPDKTPWRDRIAAVADGGTGADRRRRGGPLVHPRLGRGAPGRGRGDTWPWWPAPRTPATWPAARPSRCGTTATGCPPITAPTLVIGGSQDPSTPIEPHARTIAAGIPGARLEVLEAAHLATIEQADQATALIAGTRRLNPESYSARRRDRPARGQQSSGRGP